MKSIWICKGVRVPVSVDDQNREIRSKKERGPTQWISLMELLCGKEKEKIPLSQNIPLPISRLALLQIVEGGAPEK